MLGQVGRLRRPEAALLALALMLSGPAIAEMYKWVDEDGNVVFSQTPPPGKETEVIKPRYAKQPAGAAKRAAGGDSEKKDVAADAGGEPDKELSPEQLANKKQNCENARANLADMNSARANRLQYVDDKGERAFITEDMRKARITQANREIAENCN